MDLGGRWWIWVDNGGIQWVGDVEIHKGVDWSKGFGEGRAVVL